MLFSPILLIGALGLANASRDSNTTGNDFWLAVLLLMATVLFVGGAIIWLRNHDPHTR